MMPVGRPESDPADRRTENLQLRLLPAEMAALRRLLAARSLETGRDHALAEIARELIADHPRFQRAMKGGE